MTPPMSDDDTRWLAQEQARRAAAHDAGDIADPRSVVDAELPIDVRDALVARALRTAPMPALPMDFARQVASRLAVTAAPADTRVEGGLLGLLTGTLIVAGGITVLHYGADWWRTSVSLMPASLSSDWLAPLAGCVVLSWLMVRLQPRGSARVD